MPGQNACRHAFAAAVAAIYWAQDTRATVKRGYGLRSTIARWANRRTVDAKIEGRRYLMKVADLELAYAGRDGWQTAPEAVEAMACDIASRIPELSSEAGERLAELLRG